MLFKNITILDENFEIKKNKFVGVKGDKISYISDEMPKEDFGETYDGNGKLLMSGFFNAHAHSPMTILRGYGENMVLEDWLNKKIFPFEAKLNSDAVYYGTLLALAESLRFGIVSTSDMYYFIDDMVRATSEIGVKNNISRSISHFGDSDPKTMDSYKEMVRTFKAYHNMNDEKIKIDVSIHSEYTADPETVLAVTEFGKANNCRYQIHIGETETEFNNCIKKYGKSPVKFFYDLGALDIPTTAAHSIYLADEDYKLYKEKNVTVATNPVSNLKLASGVCNAGRFFKEGINIALGTDSVASNNSLNFFEEMKVFAIGAKAWYKDPTVITPTEVLKAATINGAISQGRLDTGLIKEGYKADLIVINLDVPNMKPAFDLKNALVYSASGSDVLLTMVDGKILYKDGEYYTIDIDKVMYQTELERDKILSQL